jgi:acyl-CoA thioester hydrolase
VPQQRHVLGHSNDVSAARNAAVGEETPSFDWPVRVYYEDTDAGGVVYHANYLRFLERARTEWLRALGFEQDHMAQEHGVIFAVRSVQIDYLRPARFNDALLVRTRLAKAGRASLDFLQQIHLDPVEHNAGVLSKAEIRVACLGVGNFRPQPLPRVMLEAFSLVR